MSNTVSSEFGTVRSFFWPIHNYELKKLLPMLLIFFCILFNYTVLRDTKDTLVVTAAGGSEVLPFLKTFCVVPAAIIFMLIYAKLSNLLSKEALFYAAIVPFLAFFALFAWVFYPLRDLLHPVASADYLTSILPKGFHGIVAIYKTWTYSLFFILAELWGSAVLSLMFWGFANEIMKTSEAKRVYTLISSLGNVSLIFSGQAVKHLSNIRETLPPEVDAWQVSLNYLMGLVVFFGLVIIAVYWWMQRNVLTDPRFYDPTQQVKSKKSKTKMSLKESFLFLARSPYIRCICLLVIGYGMAINLVEVTWKGQIQKVNPNPNDYNAFMGDFSTFTGIVGMCMGFVGGYIIRTYGWGVAAVLTPLMLLLTGSAFFGFVIFRDTAFMTAIIANPTTAAVMIGMVQNIASKTTKYALFDPTKEMAYIPLDQESKVKGKAAIDVVGARLGKSGGAVLQSILILVFGSVAAITPIVAVLLVLVIGSWIYAVGALNRRYKALTETDAGDAQAGEATSSFAQGKKAPATT